MDVKEGCNTINSLASLEQLPLAGATSHNPRILDYVSSVTVLDIVFHKPIDGTVSTNIGAMEEGLFHDVPGLRDDGCRDRTTQAFLRIHGSLNVREGVLVVNA